MSERGNARLDWYALFTAFQIDSILKVDTCTPVSMMFHSTGQTSAFHRCAEHTLPCASCKYISWQDTCTHRHSNGASRIRRNCVYDKVITQNNVCMCVWALSSSVFLVRCPHTHTHPVLSITAHSKNDLAIQ